MTIATASTPDLIYALQRQYPCGVTTWGKCATGCGGKARGSGWCADCISKELQERGATPERVGAARAALGVRCVAIERAESEIEVLREQVEG